MSISGSPSHADFLAFTTLTQPYQNVLAEGAPYDSAIFTKLQMPFMICKNTF
ncbi:MAG: hypothetical protein WDM90_20950 [Ferruginibacter sp.]